MGLTAYQAHMKRELAGKMKGKTAAQRKALFRAAAASYKKKPSARSRFSEAISRVKASRASPKPKSNGGNHTTSGFNTQKLFKYVRIGALALPAAQTIMSAQSTPQKINQLKSDYFGVWSDGSFHLESLAKGWYPFLMANVVTYGIPKLVSMLRGR